VIIFCFLLISIRLVRERAAVSVEKPELSAMLIRAEPVVGRS
jgi:hypothetical protein